MLQILWLSVIAACAAFLLSRRDKIFRRVNALRLTRKMAGPSLWELVTFSGKIVPNINDIDMFTQEQTVKYGFKPWCLWNGLDPLIAISDPETIGAALRNKNINNKDEKLYDGFACAFGGDTIINLNGPEWKLRRTLLNAVVNKNFLAPHLDVMYEETLKCMYKLKESVGQTDVCIKKVLESTLIRISIRTLLVRDVVLEDKFIEDVAFTTVYLENLIVLRCFNFVKYLFVSKLDRCRLSRWRRLLAEASDLIRKEKERMSQQMKSGDTTASTALQSFLMETLKKNSITEKDVINDSLLLISASFETTLTVLNIAICMLALHPDVQTRAAEEIAQIFGPSDRPIDLDDLSRMDYLERVIKESMRLFPPGTYLMRRVDQETDLNGTIVPEGSTIVINVRGVHRNPTDFKEPLKFDPDRFGPGAPERHPYSFMPFSSGLRNCVGRYHAMIMMKMVLGSFLRNFRVFPGRGMNSIDDVKTHCSMTMHLGENFLRLVPLQDVH